MISAKKKLNNLSKQVDQSNCIRFNQVYLLVKIMNIFKYVARQDFLNSNYTKKNLMQTAVSNIRLQRPWQVPKKDYNFLFSSRVFQYGPNFSWMRKRAHSETRIDASFRRKKVMIIDEQLIQIKQFIKYVDKFKMLVEKTNPFNPLQQNQVNSIIDEVRFKEKLLQKRCRYNSYKLERHQRNYSQPKYQQRYQYKNYRPFPESLHSFKEKLYRQPEQYFKNSMDDFEGQIVRMRIAQQACYQSTLITRKDAQSIIRFCRIIIAAIYAVGENIFRDIFSKKIMIPILIDRGINLTLAQKKQLEYIFSDSHLYYLSPWFIRKNRNFKLRNLAEELSICVEKDYIFDMRKLFEPSKYAPELTVFYSPPIRNLAEIKNIKPLASPAGANAGEYFEVEFQLGLKTVLSLSELQRQHKWAFEDYQQGLFS